MRQARITGIDLAFAMVLPLIIYYGAFLEIGQNRETFLRDQFHLIYDGAVAVFLFLIGFTSGIAASSYQGVRHMQRYLLKRGAFFIVLGLALSFFWPTNLFTLCGMASLALILVLPLHSTIILFFAAVIGLGAMYNYLFTDISTNLLPWRNGISGALNHFLREGYYALIPWLFFPFLGTLYSRTDFLRAKRHTFKIIIGGVLILVAFFTELFFEKMIGSGSISAQNPFTRITFLHLLLPTFFIGGGGLCLVVVNLAFQFSDRFQNNDIMRIIRNFGKMKYSVLFLQALGGIVASLRLSSLETYGSISIIILGFLLTFGSVAFSFLWLKRFDAGPVELVLNAITNRK